MNQNFFFGSRRLLPIFLQTEATECGLACLAMIGAYFGHDINLSGLRRQYTVSSRGATFKQLISIADRLGLQARAVKLELDAIPSLKTPCILHWDLAHFVVLKEVKGRNLIIHDPASGVRIMTTTEASSHFTGVALELQKAADFQPQSWKEKLRLSQLTEGVVGLRSGLHFVFFLSLMLLCTTMAIPVLIQLMLDDVIVSHDTNLLVLLALGFAAIVIFRGATTLLRGFLTLFISNGLIFHASTGIVRHLLHLPLQFFERRHIGDIVSRFHSLDQVRRVMTEGFVDVLVDGLMMIFLLGFMFYYAASLSWIVLVFISFYLLFRFALFQAFRRSTEEVLVATARQSTHFLENIHAIQSIKLYGGQTERHSLWQNLFTRELSAQANLGRYRVIFQVGKEILSGLERVVILYLGVSLALDGRMTIGMLVAFLAYKDQFAEKVGTLIENIQHFRMLELHLDRLADIALHPKSIQGSADDTQAIAGGIEIRQLGFRHDGDSPWIFRHLSLSIAPGENIAIVGPSGCGKTTLIKVMLGLIDAQEGEICIDGQNVKQIASSYHSQIATVMQDDQLLSGTLAENIAFFDHQPQQEWMEACAMAAAIHQDILKMPMRYHTLIGHAGAHLSGGQKQRVLLARALYRRPKILFLDEATAHLDDETEGLINQNIRKLQVTRIVIAHRIETILAADRVYMMTQGELIPVEKEFFMKAASRQPAERERS